jgi:hypothetical protein
MATKSGRCYHQHEACAKKRSSEDNLASLKTTTAPAIFTLYESIYRAFDALLRATTNAEAQAAKPKSLMAMCLRKVPDYLAELESWRLDELKKTGSSTAFDSTNTSFDIYSDLESLGMGQYGWKHLSTVVQSHGIRIVKEAILERLIADDFAILLSGLCSEFKAVSDQWQLLEAVATQKHRKPRRSADNLCVTTGPGSWHGLQLLAPQQRDRTATIMFKARVATDLLLKELIPQEWILSNVFSNMWSVAMRHLTSRKYSPDAIPFFITSIQLYCNNIQRNSRKALVQEDPVATAQQQLINSLATLTTLVLLGQKTLASDSESEFDSRRHYQTLTLCKRAEYVLRACLANAHNSRGRASWQASTYVLLLAVCLIGDGSSTAQARLHTSREGQMLADFWKRVEHDYKQDNYRQYYEATMALMASIARGCTRKESNQPAHAFLVSLCDKMDAACPEVAVLRTIRVDAAFYLADLTGDLWDLNFAEQLAATTQSGTDVTTTPGRQTATAAFSGFRWDEGISEWVTVTPAVARRKQPVRDRVTRAHRSRSADIPAPTRDIAGQQPGCPMVRSPKPGLADDADDTSNVTRECQPCRVSLTGSTELGTSCQTKRTRKQHEAQPTHAKPGVQTTKPGRRASATPEVMAGDVRVNDSHRGPDLDELRFDQADQENRPPTRMATKACGPLKRKRSRRSLVSLRPVRNISNEYYGDGESSGDELGIM